MQCQQCGTSVQPETRFCPQCGWKVDIRVSAEATPPASPGGWQRWVYGGLIVVMLIAGLSIYLKVLLREYHPVIAEQPEVVVQFNYGVEQKIASVPVTARMEGNAVVIPLQAVLDAKIVRFFDPEGVQAVPVIAYVTPEGKIVTAMSLSENCRSTDFYLKGHNIHCASCPSYWNMSSLEAYACCQMFYPDPIPSTLVNAQIRVDAEILRKWKTRG